MESRPIMTIHTIVEDYMASSGALSLLYSLTIIKTNVLHLFENFLVIFVYMYIHEYVKKKIDLAYFRV